MFTSGRCRPQWELGRRRACPFDFVRGGEVTSSCLAGWHIHGFTWVLVTQMRPPRVAAVIIGQKTGVSPGTRGVDCPDPVRSLPVVRCASICQGFPTQRCSYLGRWFLPEHGWASVGLSSVPGLHPRGVSWRARLCPGKYPDVAT